MKKFAVIGVGSFGFHVAKALFEENHEVIAIDISKDRIQAMSPYCTDGIVLDATDEKRLKSFGLEETDGVVVSTGRRISTSILICYHLAQIGVKHIIVKAEDEHHAEILKKVGATRTIHPEQDMAVRTARRLSRKDAAGFVPIEEGYDVFEVPASSENIGKALRELDFESDYGIYVVAVKETAAARILFVPPPDYVIKDGDFLMLTGSTKDVEALRHGGQ